MPKRLPTAETANPDIKSSYKPYHATAKKIVYILARMAEDKKPPITYSQLANKLGLSASGNFGALSLRWPLGSIERAIKEQLNEMQKANVPQLTSLVIRKGTNLPGKGIAGFIDGHHPSSEIIDPILAKVYSYSKWKWVAKEIAGIDL